MKVFAHVDWASEWYPKNAIELFAAHSKIEFVDDPMAADIIWLFSYYKPIGGFRNLLRSYLRSNAAYLSQRALRSKLVIGSFHHLYPPKEASFIANLRKVDSCSHVIHFFTKVNADESRRYFTKPTFVLPYWIDVDRYSFADRVQRTQAKAKLGLPADRLIIGSFQRDTEADGISPKLEKGPDILCDILDKIKQDGVFVLLSGPRRQYVEGRLRDLRIPFLGMGKVPAEAMPRLYSAVDLYLVTSRCEGGPQATLEAMATGTPIYSTRVGVFDALDSRVIFDGVEEAVRLVRGDYPAVLEAHRERVEAFDCRAVVPQYERVFAQLLAAFRGGAIAELHDVPDLRMPV